MHGGRTEKVVLWTNFLGFIWDIKKRIYDVFLLSLSAKSTFKIMNLGGNVFRIVTFLIINNDDKKCKPNSTVN